MKTKNTSSHTYINLLVIPNEALTQTNTQAPQWMDICRIMDEYGFFVRKIYYLLQLT